MTDHGVFGGRPTVLGHRGSGRGIVDGHVENTLDSLLAGIASGLRWVELDARRTSDDVLVVGHHPTLEAGDFVADLTFDQVAHHGSVTLESVLAALPDGIGVNLDVKTSLEDALRPRNETTAALLAPLVQDTLTRRPVLVSSFDPAALLVLGDAAPAVPRALLAWVGFPLRKAIPAAAHLGIDAVAPHWTSFGPNAVDMAPVFRPAAYAVDVAHRAGLEVVVWSPTAEVADQLLAIGVDAVVVDDVPTTLAALRGKAD
ncbi:MAG: glycerophosphodiester phosphodiesterase [Pedococcus sp.]